MPVEIRSLLRGESETRSYGRHLGTILRPGDWVALTGELGAEVPREQLGKLKVFSGVAEFPSRVKCASMAWHALQSAIKASDKQPDPQP